MATENKVWFITGCSTGLGRAMANYAANQGDFVVGTVRKKDQIKPLEDLVPGHILGVLMDVVNQKEIDKAVASALDRFERIDILVNNAGYGALGTIEEASQDEIQRQFDVNVYGPIRMIQAILPHMRKQKSGHILNITSIAGFQGYPGVGIYNGSKFALEGIGEALSKEVAHLGIKVTNVEPGPFRTDWAGRSATYMKSKIEDYKDSAAQNMQSIQEVSGNQVGDPVKAAQAVYELTQLASSPTHLPLGGPAFKRLYQKLEELNKEFQAFEYLGKPTDYTEEELSQLEQS